MCIRDRPLQNAETYYASVRATDYAGNISDYSVSNGITIDLTELSVISSSINTDSYLPMVDMPSLEILFSEGITPSGTTEISGNLSGSISVSMLDSSISVSFVAPFASLDTFNIRASVNDYSGKDSLTLDYTLFTDLLADYNQDLTINVQDLNEFVALWNDGNLGSDIGPFTGPIPQVTTSLDGILDLRDIMSFTRMWHWCKGTSGGKGGMRQVGKSGLSLNRRLFNKPENLTDSFEAVHKKVGQFVNANVA